MEPDPWRRMNMHMSLLSEVAQKTSQKDKIVKHMSFFWADMI